MALTQGGEYTKEISNYLWDCSLVPDLRPKNNIRITSNPLYNTYQELW